MSRFAPWILVPIVVLNACATFGVEPSGNQQALDVFKHRIMPIFRSPEPSSCVQCHLASVDLKDYIRSSHEQTFLSLRDQGLIDLEDPSRSKILDLIAMGERDLDAGARLIHARTRNAEYEAFAAWIKACCHDPNLKSLPAADPSEIAQPEKPNAVIRHARKDRLVASFERNIWSQRMRCYPCHTPNELNQGPVPAEQAKERHAEYVRQYGQRMNIFRETPEATMQHLIVSSQKRSAKRLPLINADDPVQSLMVLKPTSKLPSKLADGQPGKPSSIAPVSHGGGLKMHTDDHSYKSFAAWIEDWAQIVHGRYDHADDLPADNWYPSDQVLRVRGTPERWKAMTTIQLFVYAWDDEQQMWQKIPSGFTQGIVTPRGMINGTLILLGDEPSESSDSVKEPPQPLHPGRYLIRAFADHDAKLKANPTMLLYDSASDGETEVEATWGAGFQNAEVIEGTSFD